MATLEVLNISKSYGDFKAVNDVSFSVQPGRIYGILGPNGAGKTTTIRMVMNILLPDTGSIKLFDQEMSDELKSKIGYLPEERGLYPKMTVLDMLIFLGELHGVSAANARTTAKEWLAEMEIPQWADNKIEELSKGMQQKIQFISTVMHDPDLLILDEPFSGLDPINTQLIKNIMIKLRENGKAIMFSTHMMDAAEKLCDDIMLINRGEKVLDGTLKQIKQRHATNAVQIEYSGAGDFIKNLPLIKSYNDYGNYIEVGLNDGHSPDALLKEVVGKVSLSRFQVTESSLNDIFIDIVGGEENA